MVHEVIHEDARGDAVDATWYCSDFCARTDKDYAGWYGCQENEFDERCARCGAKLLGVRGSGE